MLTVLASLSLIKGTAIFEAFVRGAKKALPLIINILPTMAAMLCAVELLKASGAIDALTNLLSPVLNALGIPPELAPLVLLRPFSGNGALALLSNVFSECGADSYQGYLASVMLGSTETVFYTTALYFGAAGIKKTRWCVPVAIVGNTVGLIFSVLPAKLFYE